MNTGVYTKLREKNFRKRSTLARAVLQANKNAGITVTLSSRAFATRARIKAGRHIVIENIITVLYYIECVR